MKRKALKNIIVQLLNLLIFFTYFLIGILEIFPNFYLYDWIPTVSFIIYVIAVIHGSTLTNDKLHKDYKYVKIARIMLWAQFLIPVVLVFGAIFLRPSHRGRGSYCSQSYKCVCQNKEDKICDCVYWDEDKEEEIPIKCPNANDFED